MATETEDEKIATLKPYNKVSPTHIFYQSHKTIFGILSIHILLKKMDGETNSF